MRKRTSAVIFLSMVLAIYVLSCFVFSETVDFFCYKKWKACPEGGCGATDPTFPEQCHVLGCNQGQELICTKSTY